MVHVTSRCSSDLLLFIESLGLLWRAPATLQRLLPTHASL
jgi:hypothetical protein